MRTGIDLVQYAVELPNGDIILATRVSTTFHGSTSALAIFRLNHKGETIWDKLIGTDDTDALGSMALSSDGYIGIIGRGPYDPTSDTGIHYIKLDDSGTVLQNKVFYFDNVATSAMQIAATPDAGFVINGRGNIAGNFKQ